VRATKLRYTSFSGINRFRGPILVFPQKNGYPLQQLYYYNKVAALCQTIKFVFSKNFNNLNFAESRRKIYNFVKYIFVLLSAILFDTRPPKRI